MKYNDYKRYTHKKGLAGMLYAYLATANYRVVFWYRLRVKFKNIPFVRQCINMYFWRLAFMRGIEIPSSCEIGDGFYIIHSGNVVINSKCKIGKNFTVVGSATLGAVLIGDKKGSPTIGENVYLGNGVSVLGNVTIGSNVLIGANSVVLSDVPDNCFVAGAPARIISKSDGSKGYIIRPI